MSKKNVKYGFYFIKEDFFKDFPDSGLISNKGGNRPFYYCFKDDHGIIWLIPSTSKIDKYKTYIDKKKKEGKAYEDLFHFLTIGHREGVLLISNMFPIIEKYIEREYTISKKPFKLLDRSKNVIIDKKAKKILALLRNGKIYNFADIFKIESELKSKMD